MNRNEKKLKKFYKELAVWINKGMPGHKVFSKTSALCQQLNFWVNELPWYTRLYYNTEYIRHLQLNLFFKGYRTSLFPFGMDEYSDGERRGNHYTNKERLAFIFEQAGIKQEIK